MRFCIRAPIFCNHTFSLLNSFRATGFLLRYCFPFVLPVSFRPRVSIYIHSHTPTYIPTHTPTHIHTPHTHTYIPTHIHTVGAKSITCAKIITRHSHNISKFLNFFLFLFPTECKNNNFKMKIRSFFENIVRPTKINFFFAAIFLPLFNFQSCKFVIEESLHTQNYQSFFRWGYGELFWRYFCLKCQDFTQIWSSCAKSITCTKSITRFCFTTKKVT